MHAQRNAPVFGKGFGDMVRIFFAPLSADSPRALSRL
jgi:hypothetical protein